MTVAPRKWTPAEDETLIRLAPTKTVTEIAELLGRTRGSVLNRALRIDVKCVVPPNPGSAAMRAHPGRNPWPASTLAWAKANPDHREAWIILGEDRRRNPA